MLEYENASIKYIWTIVAFHFFFSLPKIFVPCFHPVSILFPATFLLLGESEDDVSTFLAEFELELNILKAYK